jgi:pimeloyl-ACP methyl ester carboxylesterase
MLRRFSIFAVALALAAVTALPASSAASPATSVDWHACGDLDGWRCGTLTVPVDWADQSGGEARIEFAVKRASGARIGALTFAVGGPGTAGLAHAAEWHARLPGSIREAFDVVAWDPRGVGASTPRVRNCVNPQAQPLRLPATGPVDWPAVTQQQAADTAALLRPCWRQNQSIAPYLGSAYVVQDLDALREALGYDQWSFYGGGHGTLIGYRYARAYPDRLRALVLDGAYDPNLTLALQTAGESGAATYAQSVFGHVAGDAVAVRLARVVKALDVRTVVMDGKRMTRWDILPAIFGPMGQQSAYPDIISVIDTTHRALYGAASRAEQRRARAIIEGRAIPRPTTPSALATAAIVACADLPGRPSAGQIASAAQAAQQNSSVFAGRTAVLRGTTCSGLPTRIDPVPEPLVDDLTLPIAPLVVNSLGDPAAPWVGARAMASYLTGASLVTYNGTQHGLWRSLTSPCINRPIERYLLDLAVPASRTCPAAPARSRS